MGILLRWIWSKRFVSECLTCALSSPKPPLSSACQPFTEMTFSLSALVGAPMAADHDEGDWTHCYTTITPFSRHSSHANRIHARISTVLHECECWTEWMNETNGGVALSDYKLTSAFELNHTFIRQAQTLSRTSTHTRARQRANACAHICTPHMHRRIESVVR